MIQKINANWGKFMQTHGDICELRDGAKIPPGGRKMGGDFNYFILLLLFIYLFIYLIPIIVNNVGSCSIY